MLQSLSKTILFMMGYQIDPSAISFMQSSEQRIIIFPHTSKIECFIGCLFMQSYSGKICFGVTEVYMGGVLGKVLKLYGAFTVSLKRDETGPGLVSQISDYLLDNPSKSLFLSPEGSLAAGEWKTGFYHISKKTKIPISIGGVDFVNHKIVVNDIKYVIPERDSSGINSDFPENDPHEIEKKNIEADIAEIKRHFSKSQIFPLFPNDSNPYIKIPTGKRTSYCDYVSLSVCIFNIGFIGISLYKRKYNFTVPMALHLFLLTRNQMRF